MYLFGNLNEFLADGLHDFRIVARKVAPGLTLKPGEHGYECILSVNARDQSRKCFCPSLLTRSYQVALV